MTTKTKATNSRNRYSDAYKAEALALAEKIGVSPAAKQLGFMTLNFILGGVKHVSGKRPVPQKTCFGLKMPA